MTTAVDAAPRGGAFASLRVPSYRAWFVSQVLSASGTVTQSVGMSWLVLQLTGHAVDLGWVAACTMGPMLVLSPRAGTLVDRVDRRRLLLTTQSVFVLLALLLAGLSSSGHARLPVLLVLAACSGVVNAIDAPARQVYVVDLVGASTLASAVGLYEVILNASRIVGPAAGGALLALDGPTGCFLLNAASYLVPLVVLLRFRPTGHEVRVREPHRKGATREGIRYAFGDPLIRSLLVLAAASGMLFNSTIVFPLLARQAFHLGGGGYGALLASFGLGALPGALAAAHQHGEPDGRLVRGLALGTAAAMTATAVMPDAHLAYLTMAVTGFLSIWFIAAANTLVQLRSAPELRGRVMGLWTMALPGTNPVTGVLIALLADHRGPRVAFATAAGLIALAALSAWGPLARRVRDAATR